MEDIWEKLSKPLPSSGSDTESIITSELRQELIVALNRHDFEYVAEGRANVVFRIRDPAAAGGEDEPAPPPLPRVQFGGTLLRVPKVMPDATPCDYETLQRFHEQAVERRVGREHVVPQVLLPGGVSPGLAGRLNAVRRRHRGSRADGGVIAPGAAMLVQDMGPSPRHPLAVEFKPKWLAQSPLAPPGAARCRSCAREAMRNARTMREAELREAERGGGSGSGSGSGSGREEKNTIPTPLPPLPPPPPPVCRLGLVHDDPAVFRATVDQLAPAGWSDRDRGRLADALRRSGVLERLRDLQVRGDPGPTLLTGPSDPDFGLAMTLRDCSCFVLMPAVAADDDDDDDDDDDGGGGDENDDRTAPAPAIVKLADVDKKNWREKQAYWQASHRTLVEDGWYEGTEDPPVETHCLLGRERDRLAPANGKAAS